MQRIDYLLRSSEPDWPRGNGQRLLYLCTLTLMLTLAARTFAAILGDIWSWPAGIGALVLILVALWSPPDLVAAAIPSHSLAARAGSPMTLDNASGTIADLILMSSSPQTRKHPSDDPNRRMSVVQPYQFTIGGDTRTVLFMQPPATITYTVLLPVHARLQTALALNPQIWQADKGDGVEFVVQISAADGRHELFRRYIDPKHNPADRRWHDIVIDLSAYRGQQVQIALITLPGPAGDGSYDWAGWAAPMIVERDGAKSAQ